MSQEKFYSKFTENKKSQKKNQEFSHKKNAYNQQKQKNDSVNSKKEENFFHSKNYKTSFPFEIISSQFETDKIDKEAIKILENFDKIIQDIKPLNSRQIQELPEKIRALSHQLTDQRNERRLGYMNENIQLSAYVRYYTWWNLIRLTRLFSNLEKNCFPQNDSICLDIGSGPLTVIIALWLSRPELRHLKLTWYCLDVSANSMALGENLFLSIAAKTEQNAEPWKIIRVKGSFGTSLKNKASFITCANLLNEMDQASEMPPEYQTKKYFDQLNLYSKKDSKFILIEPGIPKSARTLSLLRERFIKINKSISSPCPHKEECPMNGFKAFTGSKNKWCNFAFNTDSAPEKLLKLSEQAKLPKERATLSFIAITPLSSNENSLEEKNTLFCRITSDSFNVPKNKIGFYACSKSGLILLTFNSVSVAEKIKSGDLLKICINNAEQLLKDEKSGAKIIPLN